MCTAIVFGDKNRYFGRNLDLEMGFNESVVISPREFPYKYRYATCDGAHYAMMGTATVRQGYPLFYEATNERGLSMAGLNFVGNCHYSDKVRKDCINLCQFELIPYILGNSATVEQARRVIERLNLVGERFCEELALPELHWMLSDSNECAVLEITESGVRLYDNGFCVLTNNPPFEFHKMNVSMYQGLSCGAPDPKFCDRTRFDTFSRGMGAFGLPGDWSSPSRFVRAAFVRANARSLWDDESCPDACAVHQFFHILDSVGMVDGCVAVGDKNEYTRYSCCCDTEKGIYYFKTYYDPRVRCVKMSEAPRDSLELFAVEHELCPIAEWPFDTLLS